MDSQNVLVAESLMARNGERRPWQSPAGWRRAGRLSDPGDQGPAGLSSACAATPSAMSNAASPVAFLTSISARPVKLAKRRCNMPCRAIAAARSPFTAPAAIRWTTNCRLSRTWPPRPERCRTSSSPRSGTHVTEAFHHYLRPLLGTGIPEVDRLRNIAVPKIVISGLTGRRLKGLAIRDLFPYHPGGQVGRVVEGTALEILIFVVFWFCSFPKRHGLSEEFAQTTFIIRSYLQASRPIG